MKGIDLSNMATYKISEFSGIFEVNYVCRQTCLRNSGDRNAGDRILGTVYLIEFWGQYEFCEFWGQYT